MRDPHYRAAGGIVLDDHDRVLLLQRWVKRQGRSVFEVRLPKGHVEQDETERMAALREVCEETGYCGLTIVADLGEAVSEFTLRGTAIRRNEHYFLMRLADPTRSAPKPDSPDSEEALYTPIWASGILAARELLTFQTEREFAERATAWLQQRSAQEDGNSPVAAGDA